MYRKTFSQNLNKLGLFYGINANIIRKQMHLSLKNKLKRFFSKLLSIYGWKFLFSSLLLNHLEFYFNRKINSEEKNREILKSVTKSSCIKFFTYVARLSKLYAKIFKEKRFLVGFKFNTLIIHSHDFIRNYEEFYQGILPLLLLS